MPRGRVRVVVVACIALAMASGCAGNTERLITGPPVDPSVAGGLHVSRAELAQEFERAKKARAAQDYVSATRGLEAALERPMSTLMRMETHALLGVIHRESGTEQSVRVAAVHHETVIGLWRSWGDRMRAFDPETNTHERRRARSLASRAAFMLAQELRERAQGARVFTSSPSSLIRRLEYERDAIDAYDEVIALAGDAPSAEQATAWVAASHYAVGQMLEENAASALRQDLQRERPLRGLEVDMAGVAVQMRQEAVRRYRLAWEVRRSDPETQQWRALARQRLCALSGCR